MMGNNGAGVRRAGCTEGVSVHWIVFRIEVPSWGFANTGTRFGKFVQGGAATTIEEKVRRTRRR